MTLPGRALAALRRPAVAAVVLLAIYAGLSFFNGTGGYLGTDTGGKVATLEVMADHGRLDPDVGYWAQQWDPKGELHPLYYTFAFDGKWVNATTLPVLYAALPLYEAGGYRAALLLPMLGSVAAALAIAALARRMGAKEPMLAFWVAGLASPLLVYGLDFWEHSIGAAFLLWAAVAGVDLATRPRPRTALLCGALLGAAFTLRTEALVYAVVVVGVPGVVLVRRHRLGEAAKAGALAVAGFAVVALANLALELATVGESLRFSRAGGTAAAVGTNSQNLPGSRLEDALTVTLNLQPSLSTSAYVLGGAALAVLCWFTLVARRTPVDERLLRLLGAVVVASYLIRFIDGPGFVPGMFAAVPLAAVGLVAAWSGSLPSRLVASMAVAALPLVWLTMFTGGAVPQWAGRYQLVTGLLLLAAGVVACERLPRVAAGLLVAISLSVSAFGVVWLAQRSNAVTGAGQAIARRPEPVLISTIGHLFREVGDTYGRFRGLTAIDEAQVHRAVAVVEAAGEHELGLIQVDDPALPSLAITGWQATGSDHFEFVPGVDLRVTTYVRTG